MPAQLVAAKFNFPILRRGLVSRPHLVALLETGLQGPLTLVSAPAGYGKTTLLGEWRSGPGRDMPAAWLSLEPGDDDPARFWVYLAAAINQVKPGLCQATLALVQSPQLPAYPAITSSLFEEIQAFQQNLVCVLDDWHVIADAALQQGLEFLIAHIPANLHLVLLTRSDPPLPLSRLRVTQQMVEIRAEQLRFSLEETASFLTRVMGLSLSAEEIDALEKRSEGWAAGLQLAALSMQGRSPEQVEAFISAFTGSHRFIVDYLLEEVLNQQPADIREFLLKTSILESLTPTLCDVVMGWSDSQSILKRVEHSNLFLVPLDDERRWTRYHHLFRDLLQTSLAKAFPEQVEELHRRAGGWYASHNLPEAAIAHALAARDYDRAADFVEQAAQQLDMQNNLVAIARWIDALPNEIVAAHAWLCIFRAWGYHWMGQRDSVETWLRAAEAALQFESSIERPEADRKHLLGHIAAIRAHSALTAENIPRVLEEGQKALDLLPEQDEMRCETAVAMGGAYWGLGRVIDSEQAFSAARTAALKCSYVTMAVPSTCYVGMQQTKQGRLKVAMHTYQDALRMAIGPDGRETAVAGFPNVKLGDLYREQNDLERASHHLIRGVEQCARLGHVDVLVDGNICLARYQIAAGDLDGAAETLQIASQVVEGTRVDPFVQCWLEDCRLRLWVLNRDLRAVSRWVETTTLTPEGPFSYHYDLHHTNLARALLALGTWEASRLVLLQAVGLLERLSDAADRAGWVNEQIHILILRALAENELYREEDALRTLTQALVLAEPGGYIRAFLDEGDKCQSLVCKIADLARNNLHSILDQTDSERREAQFGQIANYVDRLARSVDGEMKGLPPEMRQPAGNTLGAVAGQTTPELLTARELEVLRLIEGGCSNQEIALKLVIALGTVKRHTVNIFTKLDVASRTQAVAKARELGLL